MIPRNETEFIADLRTWFLYNNKDGRAYFSRVSGLTGKPDLLFGRRDQSGGKVEFWAEAKYVQTRPREIERVWELLRGSQQITMTKMAAAGLNIYLVVCVAGVEATWYHFDYDQSSKVLAGKAPPWTAIYHRYSSIRKSSGAWRLGEPNDPEHV